MNADLTGHPDLDCRHIRYTQGPLDTIIQVHSWPLPANPIPPVNHQISETLFFEYRTQIIHYLLHFSLTSSAEPRFSAEIISLFVYKTFPFSTQSLVSHPNSSLGMPPAPTKVSIPYMFFAQFWHSALFSLSLSSFGSPRVQWMAQEETGVLSEAMKVVGLGVLGSGFVGRIQVGILKPLVSNFLGDFSSLGLSLLQPPDLCTWCFFCLEYPSPSFSVWLILQVSPLSGKLHWLLGWRQIP